MTRCRTLVTVLLLLVAPVLWAGEAGVGVAPYQATDPVGGGQMPGFVFYPST